MNREPLSYRFRSVKKDSPCVICGKPDWCRRSEDGCHECHRETRDVDGFNRVGTTGAGWTLYRAVEDLQPSPPLRRRPSKRPQPPPAPERPVDRKWDALLANLLRGTHDRHYTEASDELGVSVEALRAYQWCVQAKREAGWQWAIPMFRGGLQPELCGFRVRCGSRKWAITGTREGVFMPAGDPFPSGMLIVCEGPTDAAALFDLGFYAIGRASNMGSVDAVVDRCPGWDTVAICHDYDEPGTPAAETTKHGAEHLAREILRQYDGRIGVRLFYPTAPAKDAREWITQYGATHDLIREVVFESEAVRL